MPKLRSVLVTLEIQTDLPISALKNKQHWQEAVTALARGYKAKVVQVTAQVVQAAKVEEVPDVEHGAEVE